MPRSGVSRRHFLYTTATLAATSTAGCTAPTEPNEAGDQPNSDNSPSTDPQTDDSESVYTRVYRQTIDSVVLVRTDEGGGTGFVFDDGHVVTNQHVVGSADAVDVRFRGNEWRSGEVVGTDAFTDLAAIEVPDRPSAATPLPFADEEPEVGQEVVVIGNPYGLDGTATTGIVSGVSRSIPSPVGYRIPDAVQTDAAVNPGNSGGPIVSLDGRVVAVVNSGGGENVAFGISAALTRRVVPDLIETGEFDHAFVGVVLEEVTPAVAEANDLAEPRGVIVAEVVPDGPSAGTLAGSDEQAVVDGRTVPVGGDVILALDDEPVRTLEDLSSYLALRTRPGDTVTLTLVRDGSERAVEVTLGERPEP